MLDWDEPQPPIAKALMEITSIRVRIRICLRKRGDHREDARAAIIAGATDTRGMPLTYSADSVGAVSLRIAATVALNAS